MQIKNKHGSSGLAELEFQLPAQSKQRNNAPKETTDVSYLFERFPELFARRFHNELGAENVAQLSTITVATT